ncbi:hypothetical protein Leryth_014945 [Lithospermum erythrorhizon]|nr:hypothetical protein Leryth_014945 [Lithospermum erythrorhizon]
MSSFSTSQEANVNLCLGLSSSQVDEVTIKPEERSVKLIQLLLTCATHASSGNLHRADLCLQQISQLSSISGDSMQRLAARFGAAFAVRLIKRWPGIYKGLSQSGLISTIDIDRGHLIFNQRFPYMGFAYSIINQTLIHSVSSDPFIHILDLGTGDPQLYIPFFQNLSNEDQEPPSLRITCVHTNKMMLENLGSILKKEAGIYGIRMEFNPINISLKNLTLNMLKASKGEALAVISIFSLHHLLAEDEVGANFVTRNTNGVQDCKQLSQFLKMLQSMSPKVVFLVEQESDHNLTRLVDRFVEGLQFYSALFDSIDATFKTMMDSSSSEQERFVLEEMFGKEIENIVACEGVERFERHERYEKWTIRFDQAGFKPVRLWFDVMKEAKKVVDSYGVSGYKIVNKKGRDLMICWHDRPIYAVSAWTCF